MDNIGVEVKAKDRFIKARGRTLSTPWNSSSILTLPQIGFYGS
jgi:hypothetical protein